MPEPENCPSNVAVIGSYILRPESLQQLSLKQTGAGGEVQLSDAMAHMIGEMPFHGLKFDGRRFDCGDKVGFLEANLAFALDRDDMREALKSRIGELLLS